LVVNLVERVREGYRVNSTPIIIMSFNRPQFLRPVLKSLIDQADDSLAGRSVHLFQDGAVNQYSRIRYAADSEIDESVDVFKEHFPNGVVHRAPFNIGIMENFRRAERFVFEENEFSCAYFFEDDLILSPNYLTVMDTIQRWGEDTNRISYFAAYGNYYAPQAEALEHKGEFITLDHHWAFGLYREHWKAMQPLLKPYEAVVLGTDYSRRDHRKIFALYESETASPRASSQDAAKAFASQKLGLWRCNTFTTYAKYIGNTGQHMTPELFREIGFDRTIIQHHVGSLRFPTHEDILSKLSAQENLFKEVRQYELNSLLRNLPPRELNPLRLCEEQDVVNGYRLFLARDPENENVVKSLIGRHTVIDFISGLARSEEFQSLGGTLAHRPATRDDVTYSYSLALHREPESEIIFANHIGKTDARQLILDIWNGQSRKALWSKIEVPSARV